MDYPAFKYPALWRDGDDIRGYLPDPGPGPWFTAEQVRAIVQEAIAADLAQRAAPVSEATTQFLRDFTQHASEAGDHTPDSFQRGIVTLANRAHKLIATLQPVEVQPVPITSAELAAFWDVDPEAAYIAQCEHLNCPHCGGSGHVEDVNAQPVAREPLSADDIAIFEAVEREMPFRLNNSGSAPGHGHAVAGIWDKDNGELAGKPCAWCLTWTKFTALIAAHGIKPISAEGGEQ